MLLLLHEDTQLERKHNDFRLLMEEYHDGILLFELTDQNVWSRAVKDTAGLVAYHEAHLDDFMWDDRLDVGIYVRGCRRRQKGAQGPFGKSGDVETLRANLSRSARWRCGRKQGCSRKERMRGPTALLPRWPTIL